MKTKPAFLCATILLLCGCVGIVEDVWEEKPRYKERITGFFVEPDASILIASGEKYSYAFPLTDDLLQAIQLGSEIEMRLEINMFKVDQQNRISGNLNFFTIPQYDSDSTRDNNLHPYRQLLSPADKDRLQKAGFELYSSCAGRRANQGCSFWKHFALSGRRFEAEGKWPIVTLDNALSTNVIYPSGGTDKLKKITLTPVAFTADVLLTLGVGPVIILFHWPVIVDEIQELLD